MPATHPNVPLPCTAAVLYAALDMQELKVRIGPEHVETARQWLVDHACSEPQCLVDLWGELLAQHPSLQQVFMLVTSRHDRQGARELHPVVDIFHVPCRADYRTGHFVLGLDGAGAYSFWRMTFSVLDDDFGRGEVLVAFSSPLLPKGQGLPKVPTWTKKALRWGQVGTELASTASKEAGYQPAAAAFKKANRGLSEVAKYTDVYEQAREKGVWGSIVGFAHRWLSPKIASTFALKVVSFFGGDPTGMGAEMLTWAVSFALDYAIAKVSDCGPALLGSGLKDGGGPGGVELQRVACLQDVYAAPTILLAPRLDVFYPVDVSWDCIEKLLQRLCPDSGVSACDVPELILEELIQAMYVEKAPVFFSLHFNNDTTLYPVLHHALQRTLTGHILGFLDYYLKCFLNGGTYTEDFIFRWDGNVNREALRANTRDIRRHLREERRRGSRLPFRYQSMRDLLHAGGTTDDDTKGQKYLSAFRIIGKLLGLVQHGNTLEPKASFDVEYDLDALPGKQAELTNHVVATGELPAEHTRIKVAYDHMRHAVKTDMPQVPMFAGYFELLKVVTFSASLADALVKMGRLPAREDLRQRVAAGGVVRPFPSKMPPIPVRTVRTFPVRIDELDICRRVREMLGSHPGALDGLIGSLVLRGQADTAAMERASEEVRRAVRREIQEQVKQHDPALACSLDDPDEGYDDDELGVIECTSGMMARGVDSLRELCLLKLRAAMAWMSKSVEPEQLPEHPRFRRLPFDEKCAFLSQDVLPVWEQKMAAKTLRDELEKDEELQRGLEEIFAISDAELLQARNEGLDLDAKKVKQAMDHLNQQLSECTHSESDSMRELEAAIAEVCRSNSCTRDQLNQSAIAAKQAEIRNFYADERSKVHAQISEWRGHEARAQREHEAEYQRRRDVVRKEYEKQKAQQLQEWQAERRDLCRKIVQALTSSQAASQACADSMTVHAASLAEQYKAFTGREWGGDPFLEKLTFPLLTIPAPGPAGWSDRIVGGCGVRGDGPCVVVQQALPAHQSQRAGPGTVRVHADGAKYWHAPLDLRETMTNGLFLRAQYTRPIPDRDTANPSAHCWHAFGTERPASSSVALPDATGQTLAHYAAAVSNVALLKTLATGEADKPRPDGFRPLDLAAAAGDADVVRVLLAKGVAADYALPNGLTPLLIACQADHAQVAILLLGSGRAGNVNRCTDTGMTPLHWAAFHDNDTLVVELLERQADPGRLRRSDGFTALHLAMAKGHTDCAAAMLARASATAVQALTSDGRCCLHYSVLSGSQACCELLASHPAAAALGEVRDSYKMTAIETAVRAGSHACALALARRGLGRVKLEDCQTFGAQFVALFCAAGQTAGACEDTGRARLQGGFGALSEHDVRSIILEGDVDRAQGLVPHLSRPLDRAHRERYLRLAVQCRSLDMLLFLGRHANFIPKEDSFVVHLAATEGLHEWMEGLMTLGFDITMRDAEGRTVLDIAAAADDLLTFRHAWGHAAFQELLTAEPTTALDTCVAATVQAKASKVLDFLLSQPLRSKSGGAALCRSLAFRLEHLALARHIGLTFSPDDLVSAAEHCRPSVVCSLLSGAGITKDVQQRAFDRAVQSGRRDNAIAIWEMCRDCGTSLRSTGPLDVAQEARSLAILRSTIQNHEALLQLHHSVGGSLTERLGVADPQYLGVELDFKIPLPHALVMRGLLDSVPGDADLEFMDDTGYRALDYAGKRLGSLDEALLAFLNSRRVPLRLVLTEELKDSARSMAKEKELKGFLMKMLDDPHLVSNTGAISSVLRFLHGLPVTKEEWVGILGRDRVSAALSAVVADRDSTGRTLLMLLAGDVAQQPAVLAKLLQCAGALEAVALQDVEGRTALHHVLANLPTHVAADGRNACQTFLHHAVAAEKVRMLLLLCPALAVRPDREGNTPFLLAARCGALPVLTLLASYWPLEVLHGAANLEGLHPIHAAAQSGSVDVLRFLVLEGRVPVNWRTKVFFKDGEQLTHLAGNTALHYAAVGAKPAAFSVLLDLGADPLAVNNSGRTPLHFAAEYGDADLWQCAAVLPATWHLAFGGELLVDACDNKRSHFAATDLLRAVDPNHARPNRQGESPLVAACSSANMFCTSLMLEHGADLRHADRLQRTALHAAAAAKSAECVRLVLRYAEALLDAGALRAFALRPDHQGNTPLHLAAQRGQGGIAVLLLACPSCRDAAQAKNHDGLTPANAAALAGHRDLAIWLRGAEESSEAALVRMELVVPLAAFWATVTPDERQCARDRYPALPEKREPPKVGGSSAPAPPVVYRSPAERRAEDMKQCARHLSQQEHATLQWSEAFANPLVQDTIVAVLLERSAPAEVVRRLLRLGSSGSERPSASRALAIFNRSLFPTVPPENWGELAHCGEHIVDRWGQDLPEHHVAWLWLDFFCSTRHIMLVRPPAFYQLLREFVTLVAPHLEELPVPVLPTPTHYFSEKSVLHLVVRALQASTDRAAQVRRLNDIPYAFPVRVPALPFLDHRRALDALPASRGKEAAPAPNLWMVMEAQLLSLSCCERIANFVAEVRLMHHLRVAERSFVLEVMLQQMRQDTAAAAWALPWAAIAYRLIAEHGLQETRRLVDAVAAACRSVDLPAGSSAFEVLLQLAEGALELADVAVVLEIVRPAGLFPSFRRASASRWLEKLAETVAQRRHEAFGADRDVEQLIACFQAVGAPTRFEPHLFSFDGTPIVALPPSECDLLRDFVLMMEAQNPPRNPALLRAAAGAHAARFCENPGLETLAEMLATLREGFFQVLHKRPFRVQCMCVAAFLFHQVNAPVRRALKGRLAQVATGEGKSVIVAMLALANALQGRFVDIITSTQSLARRDAKEFRELFGFFGVTVSTIAVQEPTKEDFNGRVLYGTNTDFEFAVLRDGVFQSNARQTEVAPGQWVNRPADTAIVDEADNLFIDAALNAARVAYPTGASFTWAYAPIFQLVKARAERVAALFPGAHRLAPPTAAELRAHLRCYEGGVHAAQLAELEDGRLETWASSALAAQYEKRRDVHYVVDGGKVVIVDVDTGRLQRSSRWSRGLHEMVEVKEGVRVSPESATIASVAHPSFFERYVTVYGITGTVGEPSEREEVQQVYGLDSFDVPPHRPCRRKRLPTQILETQEEKWAAMLKSIQEVRRTRGVLVLVPTIAESVGLSKLLWRHQVTHQVFNELQKEDEAFIVHKAGQKGAVTLATNTAGRGTDIKLSPALLEAGGLHVVLGGMPPNLRVECQGLGRSGRQGQPGSNQIFISRDEPLVRQLLPADDRGDLVKALYDARTAEVNKLSRVRARQSAQERVLYGALRLFFEDQAWLAAAAKRFLPQYSEAYAALADERQACPLEDFYTRLRQCFRLQWAIFFSDATERDELGEASDVYTAFLDRTGWYLSAHVVGDEAPQVQKLRRFFERYQQMALTVA